MQPCKQYNSTDRYILLLYAKFQASAGAGIYGVFGEKHDQDFILA